MRKKSAWGRGRPPWYGRTPTYRAGQLEVLLEKQGFRNPQLRRVCPTPLFVVDEIEALTAAVKAGTLSTPDALKIMGFELEEEEKS